MRTSRPGRDYAACAPSPAMPAASTAEGKPVRLKLRRVTSFCAASIAGFAKRSLDPDWARQRRPSVFHQRHRCRVHAQVVTTGSRPKAARTPAFKWVNTALGNIKAAITGTGDTIWLR